MTSFKFSADGTKLEDIEFPHKKKHSFIRTVEGVTYNIYGPNDDGMYTIKFTKNNNNCVYYTKLSEDGYPVGQGVFNINGDIIIEGKIDLWYCLIYPTKIIYSPNDQHLDMSLIYSKSYREILTIKTPQATYVYKKWTVRYANPELDIYKYGVYPFALYNDNARESNLTITLKNGARVKVDLNGNVLEKLGPLAEFYTEEGHKTHSNDFTKYVAQLGRDLTSIVNKKGKPLYSSDVQRYEIIATETLDYIKNMQIYFKSEDTQYDKGEKPEFAVVYTQEPKLPSKFLQPKHIDDILHYAMLETADGKKYKPIKETRLMQNVIHLSSTGIAEINLFREKLIEQKNNGPTIEKFEIGEWIYMEIGIRKDGVLYDGCEYLINHHIGFNLIATYEKGKQTKIKE